MLTTVPWEALLILLPLAGGVACFLLPAWARGLGTLTAVATAVAVAALILGALGAPLPVHQVGGWGAPLGIDLGVDGLSLLMLAMTALVATGVSLHAGGYFEPAAGLRFWPLWLFLLAALNALFLSRDLFNLYVTLELMGLAAVALTALPGSRDALTAAMRYLLTSLLGSLAFLMGVALLYHAHATLDITLLGARVESSPVAWAAFGLMGAGLVLKTALFPLHFWLPPAHASAPAPVSAVLSALVVKASFYILLRLWLEVFPAITAGPAELLGGLGAAAVLWGSIQALRQTRVKLLVAYSTVAQLGYLFMALPLAAAAGPVAWNAWAFLAFSHGLAKAAMFLAAGNMMRFGGHDRVADLDRVVQRLPLTAAAFAVAGASIMGLPPSGGFNGKWLLLEAAIGQGRWGLVAVIIAGGILAAAYIFKVLGHAFTRAPASHAAQAVPRHMEWAAMLLACGALLTGLLASPFLALAGIADPFGTGMAP